MVENVSDINSTNHSNKRDQHSRVSKETDEIDKGFDALISQELSSVKQGYNDGLVTGITKHCHEGYKLGLQKGSEIGCTVGSYRGFALIAIKHLNNESEKYPLSIKKQKCLKVLRKLLKSTEEIPSTNPHATVSDEEENSIDVSDILRDMDAKYIMAKNLLEAESKNQIAEESLNKEKKNISQHKTLNW